MIVTPREIRVSGGMRVGVWIVGVLRCELDDQNPGSWQTDTLAAGSPAAGATAEVDTKKEASGE